MFRFVSLLVFLFALCPSALGQSHTDHGPARQATATRPTVKVTGAEMREGLPGVPNGVLYLTITNTGPKTVRLLGGSSAIAKHIMPMKSHALGSGHQPPALTIGPRQKLTFTSGGNHLMLMDLRRPPRKGEVIAVTLQFDTGTFTLKVPVKGY